MIILKKSKVVETHWVEKLRNDIVGGYGANNTNRTRVIKTGIVWFRDFFVELGNISRRRDESREGTCGLHWGESAGVSIFGFWGVSAEVVSRAGAGDASLGVSLFRDSAREDKWGK